MTNVIQMAWSFVAGRLYRRDILFALSPNKQLNALGGEFDWRAIGPDPFFMMTPVGGSYPTGWVLLKTSLRRRTPGHVSKLYYDVGHGMSEAQSIPVYSDRSGMVRDLVKLPANIKQLRWDPFEKCDDFTQSPIVISHMGPIARSIHRMVRVWRVIQQYGAAKARGSGVSWTRFLLHPRPTYEAASRLGYTVAETDYEGWLKAHELSAADRQVIGNHIDSLALRPLMSILMPVYNTPPDFLRDAIDSVIGQLYPNWELCIADDASVAPHVRDILEQYRLSDSRIKVNYRPVNGHISAASNTALAMARGEFIALLDHDDVLSEQALYQVVVELQKHPDADVLYSDEDKLYVYNDGNQPDVAKQKASQSWRRKEPHFKSDWNPELLYSQNYVSHLGVYRASLVTDVGGFREGFEGSQDYDLLLRCVVAKPTLQVRHIPAVLYHWREYAGSTALSETSKDYATASGVKALGDHFVSRNIDAKVEPGKFATTYRVSYPIPAPAPKVSLIIPTRDGYEILRTCIESIRAKTTYPNYEIVVVDNQSSDQATLHYLENIRKDGARVLRYSRPFNYSAINNFAVDQVAGEIVGLINNDIEVITPDWLTEMVSHAVRPDIGAVGAKLYYGDDTIQHAGVITGLGGVAGHSHKHMARAVPGYFRRLFLTQNMSAVTGACLIVRKDSYLKVGGLDEDNLAVAFNDVDFCLKLQDIGLRNVWTPYAELYHHESASRGLEDSPDKIARFQKEIRCMQERWGGRLNNDPYYNRMLTLVREDFSPDYRLGPPKPWCEGEGYPRPAS